MKRMFILLITIALIFSGCSATSLNEAIKNTVSEDVKVMQVENQIDLGILVDDGSGEKEKSEKGDISGSSDVETTIDPEVQKIDGMNVIIKGIGESIPGYVKYDEKMFDGTLERQLRGTEGITYTLNSVNIYENLEESGVLLNESILEPNGELNDYKKILNETADFIVVEMSATYIALEGEETVTVYTSSDFAATYFDEKLLEDYEERLIAGDIRDPNYIWFEVDEEHKVKSENEYGKNAYNFIIRDGETVDFRIGVFSPKELIDNENIYLCINWFPPAFFRDYNHKYFALYPEG